MFRAPASNEMVSNVQKHVNSALYRYTNVNIVCKLPTVSRTDRMTDTFPSINVVFIFLI